MRRLAALSTLAAAMTLAVFAPVSRADTRVISMDFTGTTVESSVNPNWSQGHDGPLFDLGETAYGDLRLFAPVKFGYGDVSDAGLHPTPPKAYFLGTWAASYITPDRHTAFYKMSGGGSPYAQNYDFWLRLESKSAWPTTDVVTLVELLPGLVATDLDFAASGFGITRWDDHNGEWLDAMSARLVTFTSTAGVPEPASVFSMIAGLGLLGLVGAMRRRR